MVFIRIIFDDITKIKQNIATINKNLYTFTAFVPQRLLLISTENRILETRSVYFAPYIFIRPTFSLHLPIKVRFFAGISTRRKSVDMPARGRQHSYLSNGRF